ERLRAGLEVVEAGGWRFGLIHTLTERSWPHLAWLAEFAVEHRAGLLQLHPLELIGRAAAEMSGLHPTPATLGRAYLAALVLGAEHRGRLTIGLDALLRRDVVEQPDLVYAGDVPSARAVPLGARGA